MKLVLSRKGVDSASGGCDSPLLDDTSVRRFVSFPIPGPGISYAEIEVEPGFTMSALMRELGITHLRNAWVGDKWHANLALEYATAHFDPDLEPKGRSDGWRPMLGQVGASQRHLENQGVGTRALFLFFGRFREANRAGGTETWVKGALPFHALWGWLEVETLIDVNNANSAPAWASAHPHFMHAKLWTKTRNVVYVAREHLSFEPSLPGGGVFSRYRPDFRLTAKDARNPTDWELPAGFHPKNADTSLSYHGNPKRWSEPSGGRVRLQTVGRGQEFVTEVTPAIRNWLEQLFHEETWNRADRFTETDEFPIQWVSVRGVPVESLEGVEEKTEKFCPMCRRPVVIKHGRFGRFYACTGSAAVKDGHPQPGSCDYTEEIS